MAAVVVPERVETVLVALTVLAVVAVVVVSGDAITVKAIAMAAEEAVLEVVHLDVEVLVKTTVVPIVLPLVVEDVLAIAKLIVLMDAVSAALVTAPVVLVPPMQESLVLFFKTLIKRIKIDINMTKPQVLGELL